MENGSLLEQFIFTEFSLGESKFATNTLMDNGLVLGVLYSYNGHIEEVIVTSPIENIGKIIYQDLSK
jgi:hypothetical protein